MKIVVLNLAALGAMLTADTAQAQAQPVDPADPLAAPEEAVEETPAPPPTPTPEPPVAEAPPAPPRGHDGHGHGHMRDPKAIGRRPLDPTIGLGFGYVMPTSLEAPNVTSVRFRLASGLTLEPRVELGTSAQTTDAGVAGVGEVKNGFVAITLATNLRIPLARRGRGDLVVVGGAALGYAKNDPDGDDNNLSTTSFDLNWGLGLDYWLTHTLSLSMTATNPVLSYSKSSQEQAAPADPSTVSTISIGAIFDPQLDVMLHLFF